MNQILGRRPWRRAIGLLTIGVVVCSLSAYGVMRPTSDQESAADFTPAINPLGVTASEATSGSTRDPVECLTGVGC